MLARVGQVYDYGVTAPDAEVTVEAGGMVLRVPPRCDLVVNDLRMDCPCMVRVGDRVRVHEHGLPKVDLGPDLE
jgi:hypothetical protein